MSESIAPQSEAQGEGLRQLNQSLAREAVNTSVDTGARFERIATLQRERAVATAHLTA